MPHRDLDREAARLERRRLVCGRHAVPRGGTRRRRGAGALAGGVDHRHLIAHDEGDLHEREQQDHHDREGEGQLDGRLALVLGARLGPRWRRAVPAHVAAGRMAFIGRGR